MSAKILVIDDEPAVVRTVRRMLDHSGFESQSAATAAEAQQRLEATSFDVAIVDLNLPEMNGLELLGWMKEHVPDVVPIVLSGTPDVRDAAAAVSAGAFDFVPKPIVSGDLLTQHIQRAVDHKRLRDHNAELIEERKSRSIELQNRLNQLELAHCILQSQAVAMQLDMNRAMRVQYALLPKTVPFTDRVAVSVSYRPAAKVGGDLYDVFQLDDRHVGAYVADTAGHGVSSAMLTVFLKLAMKPMEKIAGEYRVIEPGATLRTLNHMVFEEAFGYDLFISMAYLVLDIQSGAVEYSNAGHPPLLVRRHTGDVEWLRLPAPALGLNPNVKYVNGNFTLHKGDVVILYSDGVQDARDATGKFYGRQRLSDVVARTRCDAHDIRQAVEDDMHQFRPDVFALDDITVVALGLEPQRVPYEVPRPPEESLADEGQGVMSAEVRTARCDGRTFITVSGPGSWRESQRLLDLVEKARNAGDTSIILDLAHSPHLDSTFYGVLHNLASSFEEDDEGRFEIQNVTPALLREMSELGLTSVLMHFRSKPVPLPSAMRPVHVGKPENAEMGRLLLRAHEALVDADPSNADRFASVLQVLRSQIKPAPENPDESKLE